MPRKMTQMQRAQKWYASQVRIGKLRDSDYSSLSKRSALCYEPVVMMNRQNEQSLHDILQRAKQLSVVTKFKL